jgi:hypothetical protein
MIQTENQNYSYAGCNALQFDRWYQLFGETYHIHFALKMEETENRNIFTAARTSDIEIA